MFANKKDGPTAAQIKAAREELARTDRRQDGALRAAIISKGGSVAADGAVTFPKVRKRDEQAREEETEAAAPGLPPASEAVKRQAHDICVAVAEAKATAKATPHEGFAANPQFSKVISNLIEKIGEGEEVVYGDVEDFKEYLNSIKRRRYPDPTQCVETIARWPRLRKYWPRLRRRICFYCGKGTFDLSAPRLLVCGGCGEGRGVARYCSEDCQREHWPEHQKACMKFHNLFEDESERDRYLIPFIKDLRKCQDKGLTLEEYLALSGTEAERLRLARSDSA